jgi:hypothetical protein
VSVPPPAGPGVLIYWIPLGAGGSGIVRASGRLYERIVAQREHRPPLSLLHTALEVRIAAGSYIVETVWPPPDTQGVARGVVMEAPVGARPLGRLRAFRYEVRCWLNGVLPDAGDAVGGPQTLSTDSTVAARLLEVTALLPPLMWGRDQARAGEMWNSNSVISWLLTAVGLDMDLIQPPSGGRAPGWRAGISVARQAFDAGSTEA